MEEQFYTTLFHFIITWCNNTNKYNWSSIGTCAKQWIPGPYSSFGRKRAPRAYKGLGTRLARNVIAFFVWAWPSGFCDWSCSPWWTTSWRGTLCPYRHQKRMLFPIWALPLRRISSSLGMARPFTNKVEMGWKKSIDPMVGGARPITLYDACTPYSGEIGWQKVKHPKIGWCYQKRRYSRRKHSASKKQQPKQWTLQPQLRIIYRAVKTYFVIASGQGCELLLQVTSCSSGCSLCLCYDVD